MAGSHLRGSAESWFAIHEDKIKKWEEFSNLFAFKFTLGTDEYGALGSNSSRETRSNYSMSVEEVASKLKHLVSLILFCYKPFYLLVRMCQNRCDRKSVAVGV